jgi:hypothetical protein
MKRSGEVAARVDTTQRARGAMDQITRQLRSQVCGLRSDKTTDNADMTVARSVEAATSTSVTVFADFSSETLDAGGQLPAPDLRKMSWAADTFTETVTQGSRIADGRVTYASGTAKSRVVLTRVTPVEFADPPLNSKPVMFRFYRFQTAAEAGSNAPQPIVEIAANQNRALTTPELESVAKITIGYRVLTATGKVTGSTRLQNEVYVRTADPNATTPKPTCFTF